MDIDRIFDMFSVETEDRDDARVLDIYEHPAFKIGMFKKWIINLPNALKITLLSYPEITGGEKEEIKEFVTSQIFRKSFEYLEEINLEIHKETIQNNLDPIFKKCLEVSMNHFLRSEEYEKCSVLKNFQNLYKEDLPL